MLRREVLLLTAVLVLTSLIAAASVVTYSAYAIGPPPPSMEVVLYFDVDSARGFEKEVKMLSTPTSDTAELVLERGGTGSINLTFAAVKAQYFEGNATGSIRSIFYGGLPPFNTSSSTQYGSIPEGVTYNIEPRWNIPITPSSNVTVTLQISAAPNTAVRRYYLNLQYAFEAPGWDKGLSNSIGVTGYNTILTVVEGNTSSTTTTTNRSTSLWGGQVVTSTTTQVTTITSTSTTTVTTIKPAALTSTITATTTTEMMTDPSTYAWAVSATVATVVLATVLLLLRRRK